MKREGRGKPGRRGLRAELRPPGRPSFSPLQNLKTWKEGRRGRQGFGRLRPKANWRWKESKMFRQGSGDGGEGRRGNGSCG